MAQHTGERTEKPTQKKLREARDRGQMVRSRDLVVAVSSLAITAALASFGPALVSRLTDRLASGLTRLGQRPLATIDPKGFPGVP